MKKFFEKFKMRDKGTVLRTVFLVLTFINYVISIVSTTEWSVSPVYQWISFTAFALMVIVSYWYNNNWTGFASLANDIINMLSDGKITSEELNEFISKHKKEAIVPERKDDNKDGIGSK